LIAGTPPAGDIARGGGVGQEPDRLVPAHILTIRRYNLVPERLQLRADQ
jgi:hypothetical protein